MAVAVNDIDPAAAAATAAELCAAGHTARVSAVDVTSAPAVATIFDRVDSLGAYTNVPRG